jgi:uncharacterized protein (DUF1778 family)
MTRTAKAEQLQIRVSAQQKQAIQRAAVRARLGMSAYVLSRVLPDPAARFQELTAACAGAEPRMALADLNTFLAALSAGELREAVAAPLVARLSPVHANTIAAMVEFACARRAIALPAWTGEIEPLAEPVFGSALQSLRLYLLKSSPAPFRRRNLFVDATLGSQV